MRSISAVDFFSYKFVNGVVVYIHDSCKNLVIEKYHKNFDKKHFQENREQLNDMYDVVFHNKV